jgi:capsular exopolysaccharide synthesis family protein
VTPQQVNSQTPNQPENDFLGIDVRRVISRTLRYWYLIVLSLLVCLSISFLINRYSTKVFSIEASIIIKESDEVSGGELLYNNPLIKFYRNYLNELYIIKSTPLIEETIVELGLNKVFYESGDIKTSEVYNSPLHVEVLKNPSDKPFSFKLKVINEKEVEIYQDDQGQQVVHARFGDVIVQDSIEYKLWATGSVSKIIGASNLQFVYKRPMDLAFAYINRLNASWAEEGAGVINLNMRGSLVSKEVDFLNTLIKNYQEYDLEKKNVAASNAIRFIDDQITGIRDSLYKAQTQLEAFKNKNIVTDLNSEALRLYQKLEGFEVQKTELLIRASYYDYLTNYINKSPELDQVILPTSVGIEDQILSSLTAEMIAIQTELKLIARSEKQRNPLVVDKMRRIEELKSGILESVKNQKSVDQIKMRFLDSGIKEIEGQLRRLPVAENQLINIKRNYALLESLYTFLLQKRAEAGISKATNVSDVVIVNPPASVAQVAPRSYRNYLLGFGFGIAIPFLSFILIEFFNSRIQSKDDIDRLTLIPFIGGVGHKRTDQNLEVLMRPKSAISESFRAMRSNLFYFLQGKEKGVFLITSSISGEGKTFTTINLASVFTMSGKRTLIVGADMRRPKIFSDFKLENTIGLSNFLAGMNEFDEVVRATEYENLFVVSGGPVPPNPSELILHPRMEAFLATAREKFDFIFIDSPPLGLVTDAFVMSSLVDHTLFIARQNYTPRALLRTVDDFYRSGKIQRISIVLNDIYRSGPGYGYGYNYGYGYGYGYNYNYGSDRSLGGYYEE